VIVIEECKLIGDLGCPPGSAGGKPLFLHRAERVSSVFQKNMAFRDQGTVEATAPLFGVIAGTLPEREPARLPDAGPVRLSKIQETGHIYYSRLSVPFAIRSSCPIIERPRFFKAIRVMSPEFQL
jgi:hypothetical protein